MISTHRGSTTPARALSLATAVVLAATVLFGMAPASAQTVHRPLHATAPVTAAPVDVAFPIRYFGLAAALTPGSPPPAETGAAPFGEVRFRTGGRWSVWQELGEDGAQGVNQFTAALVSVAGADAYQVRGLPASFRNVRATALNLTDGPLVSSRRTFGEAAAAGATCASRADWKADESITAWTKNTDTPQYAPDQVVTVHHTAGSNDPSQNYANTVLAIEQYHVLTNGWSDIGYQYLIDPTGVVYEGRYSGKASKSCATAGGDGSDFAHRATDDAVVTGAHVAGYNTGNLGIAMLGCFDTQSATCSAGAFGANDTTPTAAAMASLEQLLGRLSTRHGLNPTGTVNYSNPINANTKPGVPTFTGHRDWEATACPGGNVYSQLGSLRSQVATDIAPTNVMTSTADTAAHLSWSPGAAWPAAPRTTRYRIARQGGPTVTTSALTFDDAGLTSGTTYRYDLTAVAADGTVSSSTTSVMVTTSGTAPPSGSDFTIAVTPGSGTLAAGTPTNPDPQVQTTASSSTPPTVALTVAVQPADGAVKPSVASSVPAGSSTPLHLETSPVASGSYTVTVTGTGGGFTHSATYTLTVTNQAPTATAISSADCANSATCTFTGTGTDPEGGSIALQWSMPNGSPSSGTGPSISTKYSSAGSSTVTLQATDPAGLTSTATATVNCTWIGKGRTKTLSCSRG